MSVCVCVVYTLQIVLVQKPRFDMARADIYTQLVVVGKQYKKKSNYQYIYLL